MTIEEICSRIDGDSTRIVEELRRLVRQPSISAQGVGLRECADLVMEMMAGAGIKAELLRVEGAPPYIYGEVRCDKPGAGRAVIFYNHYDVQPPEPLELWSSDPFGAEIRGGKMFGRGAADNKADIASRINLVRILAERGELPCDVKFLMEGEEEIGSKHLPALMEREASRFRSEACIWESGGLDEKDRPEITLGMKGMLYVQLGAQVASRDAHSSLTAIVGNPAWRIIWALSTIKGADERIKVPGWYDDVRAFTAEELRALEEWPLEEASIKEDLGLRDFLPHRSGLELKEALAGGPTATICGLSSGYTGPGSKTVLPSVASAKLDFRLVPEQSPSLLLQRLKSHLLEQGYGDIEVTPLSMEEAARTSLREAIVHEAAEAARQTFGKEAIINISSAGTGPMYLFVKGLKTPSICIGCTHTFERSHAPDENQRLDVLVQGTKWVARTLALFGGGRESSG
jgi:acetylornithine deacetylase/succinyl-diaminopimelate desuccinylase-like protein